VVGSSKDSLRRCMAGTQPSTRRCGCSERWQRLLQSQHMKNEPRCCPLRTTSCRHSKVCVLLHGARHNGTHSFYTAGLRRPLLTILASPMQLRMNTRSPSTSTTMATLMSNTVHASCRRGSARPVHSLVERPLPARAVCSHAGP